MSLLFSVRGEIGRRAFWLITLATFIAALASIIYIEENFSNENKGIALLSIVGTGLWVLCAAVVRRLRDIGLTLSDLLLLLLGAVWVAASISLLREIGEAMRILQDFRYTPNSTSAAEIARWALMTWSVVVMGVLAFASGGYGNEFYRPVVRKYAKKQIVAVVIVLSLLVWLVLHLYLGARS